MKRFPGLTSLLISMLLLMAGIFKVSAAEGASVSSGASLGDSLRVSLVTCWPGPEIYELAGHEAIRVSGPDFDYIWNYGTFDFNQPNFIGRFVSGQTDYKVLAYPFEYFLPEYRKRGSKVVEHELLISPEEKWKLFQALQRNALPENATYRYNYVKDNCATRITAMLDSTLSHKMIFPDSAQYGTFRNVMRTYHKDYPWYQFGIDLVLGSGLDYRIGRKEEMFAPVEMEKAYSNAHFSDDGGAVTGPPIILNEGRDDATLCATPWFLTPTCAGAASVLLSIAVWLLWRFKRRFARWWLSLYFGVCGLAGCLVAYLVFFSEHEATSPNILILWLNPLQLILAAGVWFRSWRYPALALSLYNAVALSVLLLIWPVQNRAGSLPIFLFMASAIILSALYIIITLKYSYYNDIPASGNSGLKNLGRTANNSKKVRKTSSARGRKK